MHYLCRRFVHPSSRIGLAFFFSKHTRLRYTSPPVFAACNKVCDMIALPSPLSPALDVCRVPESFCNVGLTPTLMTSNFSYRDACKTSGHLSTIKVPAAALEVTAGKEKNVSGIQCFGRKSSKRIQENGELLPRPVPLQCRIRRRKSYKQRVLRVPSTKSSRRYAAKNSG